MDHHRAFIFLPSSLSSSSPPPTSSSLLGCNCHFLIATRILLSLQPSSVYISSTVILSLFLFFFSLRILLVPLSFCTSSVLNNFFSVFRLLTFSEHSSERDTFLQQKKEKKVKYRFGRMRKAKKAVSKKNVLSQYLYEWNVSNKCDVAKGGEKNRF